MSAICAALVDVTALMLGLVAVDCDDGVAMVVGALATLVGEFEATGLGFIMTGVGFIVTGVGFIMTGVGFVMTGIGFIITGIGFIVGSMAGIPDTHGKQIFPFKRLDCERHLSANLSRYHLCLVLLLMRSHRSQPSKKLFRRTKEPTLIESHDPGPRIRITSDSVHDPGTPGSAVARVATSSFLGDSRARSMKVLKAKLGSS